MVTPDDDDGLERRIGSKPANVCSHFVASIPSRVIRFDCRVHEQDASRLLE